MIEAVDFDDTQADEEPLEDPARFSEAVVHATDWTTETLVSQLERGNISLTPRFQRRDAWPIGHKSRFIESLILGLPVPQVVLAEAQGQRGRYLVLDGKQRLLSLLQFWGLGEGGKNAYRLSGLDILTDLNRKQLNDLETDPSLASHYDALLNQTVRTVVIRNWPSSDFLHTVFLRLNTGSMKLSPQELRQALQPGPFSDWVDETAASNERLQRLLNLSEPDARMRDTEILARFIAFRLYIAQYAGRMKNFLDDAFEHLNNSWNDMNEGLSGRERAENALDAFNAAMDVLFDIFEVEGVARRPNSRLLNRTLLDMLLFYSQRDDVQEAMPAHQEQVLLAYAGLFEKQEFLSTIESATASTQSTARRLRMWAEALMSSTDLVLPIPTVEDTATGDRIDFPS